MVTTIDTVALNSSGSTLAEPDVTRLTTKSLEGTGVFDVLMATAKLHLTEEYNAGRITGQEYTTVYLGALTSVLQQSVAFLLNHQQEEKIIAEIALVRQKTVTELAQTDDTVPEGLGFNGTTAIEGIIKSQKDINALQASLVASQIEKEDAQIDLIIQQTVTELTQTDDSIPSGFGLNGTTAVEGLIKSKKDLEAQQIANSIKQGTLTDKQIEIADTQQALTGQQIITELAQTDNTISVAASAYGLNGSYDIEGLVALQKDKTASEIDRTAAEVLLTTQKTVTELAQTDDTASAAGVIGAQKAKWEADAAHMEKQADQIDAEILLINQKVETESAQTDDLFCVGGLLKEQKAKIAAEKSLVSQQLETEKAQTVDASCAAGLVKVQKDKIVAEVNRTDAEIELIGQKLDTEKAQTSDAYCTQGLMREQKDKTAAEVVRIDAEIELIGQKLDTEKAQTVDAYCAAGLMKEQKDKTAAEVVLLAQKANSELAQTGTTMQTGAPYLNASSTLDGVLKKQMTLYENQANGFLRDAEQKVAKIMVDFMAVALNSDQSIAYAPSTTNKLNGASLGEVITILKDGITP